ncbi:MAG: SLC13 family permease [Gemmatimonadota bacterium]
MSFSMVLTGFVVLLTGVVMVRDLLPPAAALLSAVIFLLLVGVITPAEAFGGFSNPAPITVAALYIVARAVEKTGALQPLIRQTLGSGDGNRRGLARLLVPTAGASAFLNNTPIVAMLVPQVSEWAHQRERPPSWYLMPLSFAAILGGTITLVGTSTNIVVSGLLEEAGMAPLTMFELTPVGLPFAIVGLLALLLLAPILLPDRRGARREFEVEAREFVFHMEVASDGALDGVTVEDGGLRHLSGVFLAEIQRGGEVLAPARPGTRLRGGDRLMFVGQVDDVLDVQKIRGLRSTEREHALDLSEPGHTFFEAVVSATSGIAGRTLKEVGFRGRYQAVVLGIHRSGERIHAKLGDVRIRHGDTLLLLADEGFDERWRDRSDFLLVSHLGGSPTSSTRMALFTAGVTLAMVVAVATGLVPMLNGALLAAVVMVLSRALTPADARRAVDLDVVILIAAAFGLGAAIRSSGLAEVLASGIVAGSQVLGPVGTLIGVAVVTMILTELVTNNAAAVLVFPIAVSTAVASGLDPRPFAVTVAIAASASFLTPIGYQTNTMVYGPGGYRFLDYLRLGLPMSLLVLIALGVLVPIFWTL